MTNRFIIVCKKRGDKLNENYKAVSDDLYKNGIFTDDENEIANNIARKVRPKEEEENKSKKRNNYELK